MTIKAILTDIEGTTSAVSFVFDVLFPYAAEHLPDFVRQNAARVDVAEQLDAVRRDSGEGHADTERVIAILLGWIAEDRKATPLKALQGMVWEQGYQAGQLKGHVYPDAVQALKDWHQQGYRLFVYSSGSIQAQKLIFGCCEAGDLSPLFSGYFDTTSGPKRDVQSYQRISEAVGAAPGKSCSCRISSRSWTRLAVPAWRPVAWPVKAVSWWATKPWKALQGSIRLVSESQHCRSNEIGPWSRKASWPDQGRCYRDVAIRRCDKSAAQSDAGSAAWRPAAARWPVQPGHGEWR